MSSSKGGINWTKKIKSIEREFDGLPPLPSPAALRARRASERATLEKTLKRRIQRDEVLGTVGRFLPVLALAIAMNMWPYGHTCGVGLFAYLGALTIIVIGAIWTVIWTWNNRMPKAHGVAIALALWGVALITAHVVPWPHWTCGGG
jgi:hypothetical protein